eukprot:6411844-Pyramimonas_sp.AAC.1
MKPEKERAAARPRRGRRPAGLLPSRASYHLLYGLSIVLAMAHPNPSLAEHVAHDISVGDQETIVPLASYHDSQRKEWLSAETRDQVATGLS